LQSSLIQPLFFFLHPLVPRLALDLHSSYQIQMRSCTL
jgi:hypothetical protein